ncbi:DUF6094 domain-containing protein [Thermodesulfovibrio sp. 3907-1M]|uniref:DUF6094 domain-containing protein n=1 Tax=Thermodesulfovibrio autotrophicus TaxID=3118333 RepID=A0AAU8GXM8_9BACT
MRLAGQAKCGYYPTPWEVFKYFEKLMDWDLGRKKQIYLLDPCCGDGRILEFFKTNGFVTKSYGIELDTNRARQAGYCGKVINCDIFDAIIRPLEAFSILYLNPPYDNDKEGKRMEITFFKHAHKWLKVGGLLIYIVPEHIMQRKDLRTWLSFHYKDIQCYRFPEGELYNQFKQVILFGIKKDKNDLKSSEIPENFEYIDKVKEFPFRYNNLPESDKIVVFEAQGLSDEEISKYFPTAIQNIKKFTGLEVPDVQKHFSPIFPLRKGHLLAYITSGALNGVLVGDKVLKAFTVRNRIQIETDEEIIEKDIYQTVLRVLDITKEEWYDVK